MIFSRNTVYATICCLILVFPSLVYADAPVVDATSQDGNNAANTNSDSADYAGSSDANTATVNPSSSTPAQQSTAATDSNTTSQSDSNASAPSTVTTPTSSSYPTSSMSLNDRVAQLERQIANMNQLNLLGQVNQLQQQVQDLTGQLEIVTHNLQMLQNQQKSQYTDLDQRISHLENPTTNKTIKQTAAPANINPTSNVATSNTGKNATSTDNPQSNTDASNSPSDNSEANTPQQTAQQNNATTNNQVSNSLQQQNAYQQAYNLIKNKNYSGATTSMEQFIKQYPDSSYALNAHYWLGEMYLLQNMSGQAANEFNTVISKYPQNPKTGDAMLKLGFAFADQQKWPQARKQLLLVSSRFSGSSTGQLASERLKEMKLQGH